MRASFRGVEGFENADLAIGFVDLVGYTALSQKLTSEELAQLVSEFETTAQEAVIARDGRLVKLIGDAVMFTAVDAEPAIDIALRLLEAFSERYEQILPRGGIAVGEVLTRGGDYYGPVVNLASRIADQAVPSEILVTNDVYLRVEFAGADLSKTLGPGPGRPVRVRERRPPHPQGLQRPGEALLRLPPPHLTDRATRHLGIETRPFGSRRERIGSQRAVQPPSTQRVWPVR